MSSTDAKLVTVSTTACRGTSKLLEAALANTTENGLSNAELGAAGTAGLLPPQYVDFKEQIRTEMFTIKQKMNELRASHGKATLTSFDDTNSSEVEIEVLTQDITRLFRKCEVRLQRFGDTASVSEADEKVRFIAAVLSHVHHVASSVTITLIERRNCDNSCQVLILEYTCICTLSYPGLKASGTDREMTPVFC